MERPTRPSFSVIIPAYNQAEYLGDAIRSVLAQTYQDFEIVVVNDASPDNTFRVIAGFDDPRLKYIVHPENRGLAATRNTGISSSSGDLIALLDADDFFHKEKLSEHVRFLEKHPEVGAAYNSRFDLNHSSTTIRGMWRPPPRVALSDLVTGFPFCPSDLVIRRNWLEKVGLFDPSYVFFAEDLNMNCRLALAGCEFAGIQRALSYRRFHTGRKFDFLQREAAVGRALDATFDDPRCSEKVRALRSKAYANHYLYFAFDAFIQEETELAQRYLEEAVILNPDLVKRDPSELVDFFCVSSTHDENINHESLLQRAFAQLPPGGAWPHEQLQWAVGHGYLLKGARAIMWGRPKEGRDHLLRAAECGARIDDLFVQKVTYDLLNYETEYGAAATQEVLHVLQPHLDNLGQRNGARRLNGCYWFNRALLSYRAGEYNKIPHAIIGAIANDPRYLTNRGMWAILLRYRPGMRLRMAQ